MDVDLLSQGETLAVTERVIVAPAVGVFRPAEPVTITAEGELVADGQVIGWVDGPGSSIAVVSPFCGFLMGMLARPGDRLRCGQAVAWLRAC
jgi:biotin carboxyl carrier protein